MVDYEYDGYCNAIRFPPSFSRIQCLVSINHAELSIFSLLVAIFVALLLEKASLIYSLFCYFRLSLSLSLSWKNIVYPEDCDGNSGTHDWKKKDFRRNISHRMPESFSCV